VEENVTINQPSPGKLYVKAEQRYKINYYGSDWYGIHWDHDAPFYGISEDSLMLRTVQVRVIKSDDSVYHLNMIKFSRGNNPEMAREYASKIIFPVEQSDSVLVLPRGFTVTNNEKYRNQEVLLLIAVPLNKKIELDKSVSDYNWFNIELGNDNGWDEDWNEDWQNSYSWRSNREYVMTDKGLKPTHLTDEEKAEEDNMNGDKQKQLEDLKRQKEELDQKQQEIEKSLKQDSSRYHYQPSKGTKDTSASEVKVSTKLTPKIMAGNFNIHDFALTILGRASI
jgi:hypothetical protein